MLPKEASVETLDQGKGREAFLRQLSTSINLLNQLEDAFSDGSTTTLPRAVEDVVFLSIVKSSARDLPPQEAGIFKTIAGLWYLKNNIPLGAHIPEVRDFVMGKGRQEVSVGFGGSLASGKTTLARFLGEKIGAKVGSEGFNPSENPFLEKAYEDPGYMLRTQVTFLLDNIVAGLRSKFEPGRQVSDTSVLSDIHVFMEWRRKAGKVTEEEYKVYMNLVELLKPLIPRPDLLILVIPNSVERLMEGLRERIKDNAEERNMENGVSKEDLEICIKATHDAVRIVQEDFGVQVHVLEVDPVKVYQEPSIRYAAVYKIREKLGLLKELLLKDPEKVATQIVSIFASSHEPQVVFVHSKSMFSGKTSTLNFVAEKIGREKVVTFQPASSIRWGEDHESHMIDRDGRKIPAHTISSNNLKGILSEIESRGITPEENTFIFIDEVMLFFENDASEAIRTIEELRKKGFNILCNGIDYTFQEEPFTFSHHLIARALMDQNWHEVELATRCKYCEKPAAGSRRLKANGEIAHYNDTTFEAGDNYEPVCCDEDKSCVGQPYDFKRRRIPSEVYLIPPWKRRPLKNTEWTDFSEYTRGSKIAAEHIDLIVNEFIGNGDFSFARQKIVRLYNELTGSGLSLSSGSLAMLFTDKLLEMKAEHLYPEIVTQSEELGIRSLGNLIGSRLQAMSCLEQLIENIDYLEELKDL